MRPLEHSITRRTGQPEATTASTHTAYYSRTIREMYYNYVVRAIFFSLSRRIYARNKWVCLI